jgi:acyl-coenzyme A thioesterase PaaI-like protein
MIEKLYRKILAHRRLNHFLTNLYPALFFTGIRITEITPDWRTIQVRLGGLLSITPMGAPFGGTLFTMCDPWFMMILVHHFGPEFKIWDKSATIHFRKRGKGTLNATFTISEEELLAIRETVMREGESNPVFSTQILNAEGEVIADVHKTIYIALRRQNKQKG